MPWLELAVVADHYQDPPHADADQPADFPVDGFVAPEAPR